MNWAPMIQRILEDYQSYIASSSKGEVLTKFQQSYRNNAEAALSEAIIFNLLCKLKLNPAINQDLSSGGADFICLPGKSSEFVVEVTCLGEESLTTATNCRISHGQLTTFLPPTKMLKTRVGDKAGQLSKHNVPGVLAVTTLHSGGHSLLGTDEAISFLLSDIELSSPANGEAGESYLSTELKNAIFFAHDHNDPSRIIPRHQSISAVLLVHIFGNGLSTTGVLHPEPSRIFDYRLFPDIPFLRISKWPIQNGSIEYEWVISEPCSRPFDLFSSIPNC